MISRFSFSVAIALFSIVSLSTQLMPTSVNSHTNEDTVTTIETITYFSYLNATINGQGTAYMTSLSLQTVTNTFTWPPSATGSTDITLTMTGACDNPLCTPASWLALIVLVAGSAVAILSYDGYHKTRRQKTNIVALTSALLSRHFIYRPLEFGAAILLYPVVASANRLSKIRTQSSIGEPFYRPR